MKKLSLLTMLLSFVLISMAYAGGGGDCGGMNEESCAVFSLTNTERLKAGLSPLSIDRTCVEMAQEHSEDMAARDYFDHDRPAAKDREAESYRDRARRWGMTNGFGENIAMTSTPERAVQMWMKSPGHRRNILNPKFRMLGVGFRERLYTQSFSN